MLYYKKRRCVQPQPDDIFQKPQMAVWLFAASFIFDSFRQDFLSNFRKFCRKFLNYLPGIFKKERILSNPYRKIRKYLSSVEIYHPSRAPPLESDIKIHFRFSEVRHEQQRQKFFHYFFLCVPGENTLPVTIRYKEQQKGGEGMNLSERRQLLLEVLCLRRHDTYDNLAHEFNVSKMTIRRDIAALTLSYPIDTVRGRYGGGVQVRDEYQPYRKTLNKKQVALLIKLSDQLEGDDFATISSIIFQLAP